MAEDGTAAAPTTTRGRIRHPVRVEKHHVVGFLVLLAVLDLIVLALAGYALDKIIDGQGVGNGATFDLAVLSLIAGMVTFAAILAGLLHFRHYNASSLSGASTMALIAWVLSLLAFGLACKQANIGHEGSKMRALEAFVMLLAFFETVYLFILHAGLFNSKYGVGY